MEHVYMANIAGKTIKSTYTYSDIELNFAVLIFTDNTYCIYGDELIHDYYDSTYIESKDFSMDEILKVCGITTYGFIDRHNEWVYYAIVKFFIDAGLIENDVEKYRKEYIDYNNARQRQQDEKKYKEYLALKAIYEK